MKLFDLMATLGLDTSEYEKNLSTAQTETKQTVEKLKSEYKSLSSSIGGMQNQYNKLVAQYGSNSDAAKQYSQKLEEQKKRQDEVRVSLEKYGVSIDDTTNKLNNVGNASGRFNKSTETFADRVGKAAAKAQLFTSALTALGTKLVSFGTKVVNAGIEYNAQMEQYSVALENLLGSAEKAGAALSAMKQDAARTPFDTSSIVKANRLLISTGKSAESARATVNALGDAVAASGGGNDELVRMASNLQQIANVGKATEMDVRQFAMAGIDIYGILADYTGQTTAQVKEMTVTYDLLAAALENAARKGGRYYGAMEAQSQTLNGRISTLKDNAGQLIGALTEGLTEGEGRLVESAIGWVQTLKSTLEEKGPDAMWEAAGDIVLQLGKSAAQRADNLVDSATEVVSKFSGYLADNSDTIVQSGMDFVSSLAKGVIRNAPKIGDAAKFVVASFVKSVAEFEFPTPEEMGRWLGEAVGEGLTAEQKSEFASWYGVTYKDTRNAEDSQELIADKAEYNAMRLKSLMDELSTASNIDADSELVASLQAEIDRLNAIIASLTSGAGKGGTGGGKSKDTPKVVNSLTEIFESVENGISKTIQKVTDIYDDGTEKITKKTIETGTEIVDGAERVYTTITTEVNGAQAKVEKTVHTTQKAVQEIDKSVKGLQTRIEGYISQITEQSEKGIVGALKNGFYSLVSGDWGGVSTALLKLFFGEISQEQREIITKWASEVLAVINESYSGGGVKAVGDTIKAIFTDGVTPAINESGEAISKFSEILSGLGSSGGAGATLVSLAGNLSGIAGSLMSSLDGVIAFVAANPEILAILAVVAGLVGLGVWLWNTYGKDNSKKEISTSKKSGLSYRDIQDAYWYGNERAFAGYDFRTDPYTFREQPSALSQYQQQMQTQLAALTAVVQEYLPQTANMQMVLDDGTLVGALTPGINTQMGQLAALAERGN